MIRRYITSSLAALLMLAFFASTEAQSQNMRPGDTFYLMPRVGIANYVGDRDPGIGFMNEFESDGFPWLGSVELGYQFSPSFAIAAAYEIGDFTTVVPDEWYSRRHIAQLLLRYTFGADNWRLAPFIDVGGFGTRGYSEFTNGEEDEPIGFGPTVGLGFDIALNDRTSLFIRGESNFVLDDFATDGAEGLDWDEWNPTGLSSGAEGEVERPDAGEEEDFFSEMDALVGLQLGLKLNFRSAFTPVEVMSLDCPADPIEVGETATFTAMTNDAEATQPVTYTWDFGAAGQAEGLVVTRSFDREGTYTVSFTADNGRDPSTLTCSVVVEPPPVPPSIVSMDADPAVFDVCEPQTVRFSANVRGDEPIEYSWNFGDGSTGRGPNPTNVYETPGTYTVTLEVTSEFGTETRSMTVEAEPCIPEICLEVTEMNPVFFPRNSSTLTAEARAALRENLELFEECPNLCARIEGYAAPGERNAQELSEDRARAVEEFYTDNGIAASRFETVGVGVPAGVQTTKKEGASQYRRVSTIPMDCEMGMDMDMDDDDDDDMDM